MNQTVRSEDLLRSFGIAGTNVSAVPVGSVDDVLDAFRRYSMSTPDSYTLENFKHFVAAVKSAGCKTPGLEYYGNLLDSYVQRVPDLGWERCARQVWPLLGDVKAWIENQNIPLDKIGVRPVFKAAVGVGGYEIYASLCNHGGGVCDCGH